MILAVAGDSFLHGNELADYQWNTLEGSHSTFAALLANYNSLYLRSCARPGNSNDAVARQCIQHIEQLKINRPGEKIFALVAWTFISRFEFPFESFTSSPTRPWACISANFQMNKPEVNNFAELFFKHIDTDQLQSLNTIKIILILQNYLDHNKIPYLFTLTDNIVTKHKDDILLKPYWDMIHFDKWFFFPPGTNSWETTEPRGFYQWALENKYRIGKQQHPLEEAHQAAAELMKEKFNELVTKSLE